MPRARYVHPSRRLRLLAVAFTLSVAIAVAEFATTGSGSALPAVTTAGPNTAVASTADLAFAMPSTQVLRSSPKKVFAHYLPSFPVSLDNRDPASDYYAVQYVAANGERGKHAAYGGLIRDRPAPRSPREGDWRLADMQDEVRSAIAAGIDGFTVDLLGRQDNSRVSANVELLLRAAASVDPGFSIVLMPDMTAAWSVGSPEDLAAYVAHLATFSAAYRIPDGRLVVAPYTAEKRSVAWWSTFLADMGRRGTNVALVPVFQNEAKWSAAFSPLTYGMGNWGSRNPASNVVDGSRSPALVARAAATAGKVWMAPVSIQDERPRSAIAQEAENSTNLRNSWQIAIDSDAPWVQLATWNDYSEGTSFAPSAANGPSWLDLSAYYLVWFKTGAPPALERDVIYVTSRVHPFAAQPILAYPRRMTHQFGSAMVDRVEVLAQLHAPGTVTVTTGTGTPEAASTTCVLPAGVGVCVAPLAPGQVSAILTAADGTLTTLVHPHLVTTAPLVQDLAYYVSSSARQGTSQAPAPAPAPTTSASPVGKPAPALPGPTLVSRLAPRAPASLKRLRSRYPGGLRLMWKPSVSVRRVAAYDVQRSTQATFPTASTRRIATVRRPGLALRRLPQGTWYFRVVARDVAGARSRPSRGIRVVNPDTRAPGAPGPLRVSTTGQTVDLSWGSARDNVGVVAYSVTRTPAGATTPATVVTVRAKSFHDTSVTPGEWSYSVIARDRAGHRGPARTLHVTVRAPTTREIAIESDTYLTKGAPALKLGNDPKLIVRGALGVFALLRAVVPAPPEGQRLLSATLHLHTPAVDHAGSGDAQNVLLLADNGWTEDTTWNVRPQLDGAPVVGIVPAGASSNSALTLALDTTKLVGPAGATLSLAVAGSGSDDLWLESRESPLANERPSLTLVYG